MRTLLLLAVLGALTPAALAEPTSYGELGEWRVFSGVATTGSRDAFAAWRPDVWGCEQTITRFHGVLRVLDPDAIVALEADALPIALGPGIPVHVVARRDQSAELVWQDEDVCPEFWVEGVHVAGSARFELRIRELLLCVGGVCR